MTIGHSGRSFPIVVVTCLNGGSTKYNCCKLLGNLHPDLVKMCGGVWALYGHFKSLKSYQYLNDNSQE